MRSVIAAGASITTVAATGWAYQVRASARDRRRLAPPGRLVDAGGHRLHIHVTGADHGGPTVVLEAGGMATSPMWALIQPGVADFARVVSYDRAGLGWSETGPRPRDARSLGDLPLTVLTAPDNPGLAILREPWLAMQRELAGVSSSARHYVLDGAGHIDMATQPDPIRVLARGIRDLIDLVT